MDQTINVLVADSGLRTSKVVTQAVLSLPGVNFLGNVRSQEMLVAKIRHLDVDLVLIDPDSDGMGGVAVVSVIKNASPHSAVIVVSDAVAMDPVKAVAALEMGATDCMEKPGVDESRAFKEFRLQLITMTGLIRSRKAFSRKNGSRASRRFQMSPSKGGREKSKKLSSVKDASHKSVTGSFEPMGRVDVVVIASSTGGPGALVEILPKLPADLGVPVLLVQHMPSHMTASFAKSLNQKSGIEVTEALDGDEIVPSKVYIAPGGRHMAVSPVDSQNRRFVRLNDAPMENSVRPSADVLFRSVAESFRGNILAVVLTGMGEDGKKGIAEMKRYGCFCLTQSSDTCIVYGMPRAVDEAGLSDVSLDLEMIAIRIVSLAGRRGAV